MMKMTMIEPQTLNACLLRAANSSYGVRFVTRRSVSFHTYDEIASRALAAATGLRAKGVEPGDRVCIVVSTGLSYYDAFFGTLFAGGVPVTLPLPLRFGRDDDYVRATSAMLEAAGAKLAVAAPRATRLVSLATDAAQTPRGTVSVEDIRQEPSDPFEPDPRTIGVVQFSSGTTGRPKPIPLTHSQILTNVESIARAVLNVYPESDGFEHSGVSWLPLYHDMGLVGAMFSAVVRPGRLTLMAPEQFVARPALWLQELSSQRATISAAPHFAYALCLERVTDKELEGVDLSSWRVALDGAEAVTPATLEKFIERFAPYGFREEALTPVYGLAEASLAVTFSDLRKRFRVETFDGRRLVSCGAAVPGIELRIADEDDAALPEGEVGRVLIRGRSVMRGYLGQPEETRRVLSPEGWFKTGDLGFLSRGELFLTSRESDLIILRGRNYAPDVFEEALEGLDGVTPGSVAAIGAVTDAGEALVILAERRSSVEDFERAVSARLSERTGIVPARVMLVEPGQLPRTSSGKIRRQEVARRFKDVLENV